MKRGLPLVMLLSACDADVTVIQLPFEDRHGAAMVQVEHKGEVTLFSVDATKRDMTPILQSFDPWEEGEPISMTASFYESSFTSLQLPGPGRVTSAVEGRTLSPGEVFTRTLQSEEELGEWTTTTRWPAPMSAFRFGGSCRVVEDGLEAVVDPSMTGRAGMVARPDGSAILVLRNAFDRPSFFHYTLDGITEIESDFDERVTFAFRGRDDRMYLVGGDSFDGPHIYAGDPRTGFELFTSTTSTQSRFTFPHASTMGEDGVIFGVTSSEELVRIEGDQWETVARVDRRTGRPSAGGVVWLEPEVVLFMTQSGRAMYRYENGVVRVEETEIDSDLNNEGDQLLSILHLPGVGTFAGAYSGTVLTRGEDRRWRILQPPLLIQRHLWTIQPLGDGIVFSGRYGVIDQFYPDAGICEDTRFRYGNDVTLFYLVPIDGGFATFGDREVGGGARDDLFMATFRLP